MGGATGPAGAHLRVARPTDDLDAVARFYRDGVGFDGVMRRCELRPWRQ